MLWRVKFPPKERILILALLSSSVLTLLSTTVYCIFWFIRVDLGPDTILLWSMTSQIEVCPSLSTSTPANASLGCHIVACMQHVGGYNACICQNATQSQCARWFHYLKRTDHRAGYRRPRLTPRHAARNSVGLQHRSAFIYRNFDGIQSAAECIANKFF